MSLLSVGSVGLAFLRRWLRRRGSRHALVGLDPLRTRLVVGLGNPGPEFAETRHNLGFRCADELAQRYAAAWQDKTSAWDSLVAVIRPEPALTVVLARPQTFMNRSGYAVRALVEFLGLPTQHCLVVYDDMDLPFGILRVRERGSAGTHNGMRSVVARLETDSIARLRIGISQASPGQATAHVLSEFGPHERAAGDELVKRAADAALAWAIDGAPVAMNRYNSPRT